MRLSPFYALLLTVCLSASAQQVSQTIRGTVTDQSSGAPMPYAAVQLLNTNPALGTVTDSLGNFFITQVPMGRYDVQVSYLGYEPAIVREIQVTSAKETVVNITVKENSTTLADVVVKPKVNKEEALNNMATLSARMLSVEEAKRYAGGFDDPARLASSFAGVASNVGNNGIAIRGNAPKFLQWKMEGIEIPNPNHFADLSVSGGGGLTALSSHLLANSDFFTGAFPAEYNNALSGVFDIFMRSGNNQKYEHTLQVGIIGIDASSEGPFKKGKRSSYLFNYRYSTLALLAPLLPDNAGGVKYQDLSFKFNFPTKKAGTFSFWGIGLLDGSGAKAKTDSTKWQYQTDKEEQKVDQYMGATGFTHKVFLSNSVYFKSTLAATVSGLNLTTKRFNSEHTLAPLNNIQNTNWNFVLSTLVNIKANARHTNRTGVVVTGMMYDLLLKNKTTAATAPTTIVNAKGFSTLISAYTNSGVNLTDQLLMNLGVNAQFFTLNNNFTIEPRLGFKWQFKPAQSLSIAYGLHSRLERLNYYFNNDLTTGETAVNKALDFSKAHHLVLAYNLNITDEIHLRIEPYFQYLYNVPVIADSSFSFINLQNDWFFAHKLENTGEGMNYGLDITLEKYLSKGYYFIFTASVFNSRYKGGDGVWRNTRFNRNFLFNFLTGKEWQVGKKKQNTISLNTRLGLQGGDRYSPVNEPLSMAAKEVVYDETNAFSKQLSPALTLHFTAAYKVNLKKTAHEVAMKVINVTQQKDFFGYQYNYRNNTITPQSEAVFIPNISYKIEF
jgi:hypothetical protein